jgi:hypothetical protein
LGTENNLQPNLRRPKKEPLSALPTAKFTGIHHSAVYREIRKGTAAQLNSNLQTIDIYCTDESQKIHELHHAHCQLPNPGKEAAVLFL